MCSPSRVERLVSPIFTKLAQLWGMLEEQFREIDSSLGQRGGTSKGKVARAKEAARRQRLKDSLNDTAANLQDEMLLLEDVLKVRKQQCVVLWLFLASYLVGSLLLHFLGGSYLSERTNDRNDACDVRVPSSSSTSAAVFSKVSCHRRYIVFGSLE